MRAKGKSWAGPRHKQTHVLKKVPTKKMVKFGKVEIRIHHTTAVTNICSRSDNSQLSGDVIDLSRDDGSYDRRNNIYYGNYDHQAIEDQNANTNIAE